jgi:hypothetical protein
MLVLVGMTLWAILGYIMYYGADGSYATLNWFFVTADPSGPDGALRPM